MRCAVVGASGYAGAELVSILSAHPEVSLVSVHAEGSAGTRWEHLYPARAHRFQGRLEPLDPDRLAGVDVVFLALPHGESARSAAALRGRVGKVIDLSGDLRFPDAETYAKYYGTDHPAPDLLGEAVYGLPELFRDTLIGADLIACAGCYATVSQLAAAPALRHGSRTDLAGRSALPSVGTRAEVVISAMSGTTGAGRKGALELSFSEVSGNLRAYRVGRHPHAPEIAQGLSRFADRDVSITFVPHLVPIARGIFATAVLRNEERLGQEELLRLYRQTYAERPFLRVIDPAERLPQVSDVVETNFCDLAPFVDESAGTIVVLGVIDNLVKGAAGQAVQVMNIACGLPEPMGLLPAAIKEGVFDV